MDTNSIIMKLNLPDKEICEEYINGISSYKLADKYNCHRATILNRLHENNINTQNNIELNLPDDKICKEYINGVSAFELANKYNCSKPTILSRLRKNNIEIQNNCKSHSYLSDDKICEEYINGMSTFELANKYNCSKQYILKILHINNIVIRNSSIKLNLPDDKICKEYCDGLTQCDIANKYNCCNTTILSILRKNNIEIRNEVLDSTKQRMSATLQGISYNEWESFVDKDWHDWSKVIYLNEPFKGCHRHHLTEIIVACIPAELHNYIYHNLKKGINMGEINMLSLQFIHGCYD